MTRCSRAKVNLKSTAYNPTGQNFFEQLSIYNSMSSHLRRILLAESVVDARNKCYVPKKRQQRRTVESKPGFSREEITDAIVDKLAYDTRHHPADLIKMSFESKCTAERKKTDLRRCAENYKGCQRPGSSRSDQTCCEERPTNGRTLSTSRTKKSTSRGSGSRASKPEHSFESIRVTCNKKTRSDEARSTPKSEDCFPEQRYEDDFEESDSDILTSETNHVSTLSSPCRSYEDPSSRGKPGGAQTTGAMDEEAKYADFVYEITREIMQHGLYKDEELQEVFKKHLEKNKGILNMSKMLYEIYQLKISLNVSTDSDVDEELEDLIHAQQLLSVAEIRPPTPPKVLDDNKVMEKLISYQQVTEGGRRSSASGNKSVLLVDPNPELLVTERDVLLSLLEANIEPKQAQQICKSLLHRSKHAVLPDTVQVEAQDANAERIVLESTKDGEVQEKSCTTTDLISRSDKDTQAE